jgi:hypothetical protein
MAKYKAKEKNKGGACHKCGLAIYMKKSMYLKKAKEESWRFKYEELWRFKI